MDHERQMKNEDIQGNSLIIVEKTKEWFLRVSKEFSQRQANFNLETEFAKTKKNRNYRVLMVVLATAIVLIVGTLTYGITYEQNNNQARINTNEFEDIDRRDLLAAVREIEDELEALKLTISQTEMAQEMSIDRAQSDWRDQTVLLRTRYPNDEDYLPRKNTLDRQLNQNITLIRQEYADNLQPLRTRSAELETQLAQFDQKSLESARSQELLTNSERNLFSIEKARLRAAYDQQLASLTEDASERLNQKDTFIRSLENQARETLKSEQARITQVFNPAITDQAGASLLNRVINTERLQNWEAQLASQYLTQELISQGELDRINTRVKELQSVFLILDAIPWINSMPQLLAQIKYRSLEILDIAMSHYDGFWQVIKAREDIIVAKDQVIAERTQAIAAREATIRERESTIREKEAAISSLETAGQGLQTEIQRLEARAKAYEETIAANNIRLTRATFVYEQEAVKQSQEAIVVDPSDEAGVVIYIRTGFNFNKGQRVLIVRGGTDLLGEYEVASDEGVLRVITQVAMDATLQALADRVDQRRRSPATNDWVVRKEAYVQSRMYPRAPRAE